MTRRILLWLEPVGALVFLLSSDRRYGAAGVALFFTAFVGRRLAADLKL